MNYEIPKIEVIKVESKDIIQTSSQLNAGGGTFDAGDGVTDYFG